MQDLVSSVQKLIKRNEKKKFKPTIETKISSPMLVSFWCSIQTVNFTSRLSHHKNMRPLVFENIAKRSSCFIT